MHKCAKTSTRANLQLLGVVLSLMSLPMSSPKDSMMAEILFHSSFSSKGDRMERLFSVELRFSLAAVSPVVVGDHVFSSLSTSIALRRKDNYWKRSLSVTAMAWIKIVAGTC